MSSEIMLWLCLDNYLRMEFLIWFYSKMCLYRASRGSYDKSHFLNKLADNMLIYLKFGEEEARGISKYSVYRGTVLYSYLKYFDYIFTI